jgi:hypothetical protein
MDPREIEPMVDALSRGYDLAKGSRFMPGGGTEDITWFRRTGNRGLLSITNLLYRTRFTELCYGYMGFRRDLLPRLRLTANGFDIEAQIVTQATRAGARIVEVPSFESPRRHGASSLNAVRDGFRILGVLLRERFRARLADGAAGTDLVAERREVR